MYFSNFVSLAGAAGDHQRLGENSIVWRFTGLKVNRFTAFTTLQFTGFQVSMSTYLQLYSLQVYIFTALQLYSFTYLQLYICINNLIKLLFYFTRENCKLPPCDISSMSIVHGSEWSNLCNYANKLRNLILYNQKNIFLYISFSFIWMR